MSRYDTFQAGDLKLVYRVLHGHLTEHLDLMDSDFFDGLQRHLQALARADGVDIADHAQWDKWLGQRSTPCEERVAGRSVLRLVRDDES